MYPPVNRSRHHGARVISRRQAREVFQSSCTSWSSKTMADGTVLRSHRTAGLVQESR